MASVGVPYKTRRTRASIYRDPELEKGVEGCGFWFGGFEGFLGGFRVFTG